MNSILNPKQFWGFLKPLVLFVQAFLPQGQKTVQAQLERIFTIPQSVHDDLTRKLKPGLKERADAARKQAADGLADYTMLIASAGSLEPDDDYIKAPTPSV